MSNYKRLKAFYVKLNTTNGYKEGLKGNVNYTAEVTQEQVNIKLRDLNREIQEIEIKLANFNHNTKIEVNIDESLKLFGTTNIADNSEIEVTDTPELKVTELQAN